MGMNNMFSDFGRGTGVSDGLMNSIDRYFVLSGFHMDLAARHEALLNLFGGKQNLDR